MEKGLVKHIGVSNFSRKKLKDLLAYAKIRPAVSQVYAKCCRVPSGACMQRVSLLRDTSGTRVQQLNHYFTKNLHNMVLRSQTNRLELMKLRCKA